MMDAREGCYISPVCIDTASSFCCLDIASLKLFVEGVQEALLLLVANDSVLFEATVDVSEPRRLRILVPSRLLSRTKGAACITVYVVRCGSDGCIAGIIDSGKVLVFSQAPAADEIATLFEKVKRDCQQYFKEEATDQQQPAAQSWSQRAWQSLTSLCAAQAAPASRNAATATGTSTFSIAAGASAPDSSAPDAVTLYAYEHFMLPFIHHWAALLRPQRALLMHSSTNNTDTGQFSKTNLAKRLLHFLLDNEMWACALLLLGVFPSLADEVLQAGLELPEDYTNPIILQRLRAAIPARGQQNVQLLQQMREFGGSTYTVKDVQHASPPSSSSDNLSNDGSSYESDSELLRQVECLQQARAEQEYLAHMGYLQAAPELLLNSASEPLGADGAGDGDASISIDLPGTPASLAATAATAAAIADRSATQAPAAALAGPAAKQPEATGTSKQPPSSSNAIGIALDTIEQSQQQEEADYHQQPAAMVESDAQAGGNMQRAQQLLQLLQQHKGRVGAAAAAAAAGDDDGHAGSSSHQWRLLTGSSGEQQHDQQLDPNAAATAAAAAASAWKGAEGHCATASMVQLLPYLVRVAITGFTDSGDEHTYAVYKSRTNASMDAVGGVLCAGMLAAAGTRSTGIMGSGERAWEELCVVLLCSLLFLHPYVVLHYNKPLFLRVREVLLASGRILSGAVLVFIGLGRLPQPAAWVSCVKHTVCFQVNSGLILPICQQLRMPAAAVSSAVRFWSDGLILALGRPLPAAMLQSFLVHACAMLVALVLDVWCRYRFVQSVGVMIVAAAGVGREKPRAGGEAGTSTAAAGAGGGGGGGGAAGTSAARMMTGMKDL